MSDPREGKKETERERNGITNKYEKKVLKGWVQKLKYPSERERKRERQIDR